MIGDNMSSENRPVITLLTDFGLKDGLVGAMKGVILGINPNARIVDVSHDIPAWNIKAAAFVLCSSYKYFPKGTIHICVVDPEVGSDRKILLAVTPGYYFLAPDNGLLTPILKESNADVFSVSNPKYYLHDVSNTFHGRDIFAPVAAHLSLRTPVKEIGLPFSNARTDLFPKPEIGKNRIKGRIYYIDNFGNLITNIHTDDLSSASIDFRAVLNIGDISVKGIHKSYSAVAEGEPVMIISSAGFLEIGFLQHTHAAHKMAVVCLYKYH